MVAISGSTLCGGRREILALGHEIADLAQEALVGGEIERASGARGARRRSWPAARRAWPAARGCAGARSSMIASSAGQKDACVDARARQRLVVDEVVQDPGDLEAAGLDSLAHGLGCSSWVVFAGGRAAARRQDSRYPAICASPPASGVVPRFSGRAWRDPRRCAVAAPGRAAASRRAVRRPAPPGRRSA